MVMRLDTASGGRRCRCEGEITDFEPVGWRSGGDGKLQGLNVNALADEDVGVCYQGTIMETVALQRIRQLVG